MRRVTRLLLLLNRHLLSLIAATAATGQPELPTRSGLNWLEEQRSVLVRLDVPLLPLWNQEDQIGEDLPSALIFNFTLSHDNRTLLLNDNAILPLGNAYVPPRLYAYQTSKTLDELENDPLQIKNSPQFSLDYSRIVPQAEDGSLKYNNYTPTLDLDILGAGIGEYNTLLPSDTQRFIRVILHQLEPPSTPFSSLSFKIADIHLEQRHPDSQSKGPDGLKPCTLWSWLCADKPKYPWYQYIYRENFDDYGKIGSMRRFIHFKWATVIDAYGPVQVAVLGAGFGIVILSLMGYGIYRLWKRAQELWQRRPRGRDIDAWTADEELGGLLDDIEVEDEDYGYVGRNVVELADWTGNLDAEKPLPPLPPPVPPKAGEGSHS